MVSQGNRKQSRDRSIQSSIATDSCESREEKDKELVGGSSCFLRATFFPEEWLTTWVLFVLRVFRRLIFRFQFRRPSRIA